MSAAKKRRNHWFLDEPYDNIVICVMTAALVSIYRGAHVAAQLGAPDF